MQNESKEAIWQEYKEIKNKVNLTGWGRLSCKFPSRSMKSWEHNLQQEENPFFSCSIVGLVHVHVCNNAHVGIDNNLT